MEGIKPRIVLIDVTAVNDLASSHMRIYDYPFTVSTSYRLTTKLHGKYQYATCQISEMANSKLLVGWSLPCASRVLHGMTVVSAFDNHVLVFSDLSSSPAPSIYITFGLFPSDVADPSHAIAALRLEASTLLAGLTF